MPYMYVHEMCVTLVHAATRDWWSVMHTYCFEAQTRSSRCLPSHNGVRNPRCGTVQAAPYHTGYAARPPAGLTVALHI
jgi:hypothetical protein